MMEVVIRSRLGIGFDIEHNEENCYRVGFVDEKGKEEETLLLYVGLIIKIPFLTIFIGDFLEQDEATNA